MIEPSRDPSLRLTQQERANKRIHLLEEVDNYIKETILYCDDEQELIALGSVLQILSKNILTSVMNKTEWKDVIIKYIKDVEKESDLESINKKYRNNY
jgi:hypothetical protein